MGQIVALIVAAGRGSRTKSPDPKQYSRLGGHAMLFHTIKAFHHHPQIDQVVCVIHKDDHAAYKAAIEDYEIAPPVDGGKERQISVRLGLEALAKRHDDIDYVLIHDAARPFIEQKLIDDCISHLRDGHKAVLPVLPVIDTIKQSQDGLRVDKTIPRSSLWRAQTPQSFDFQMILQAHQQTMEQSLTDDAAIAEATGHPVQLCQGAENNVKITTQEDLIMADQKLSPSIMPAQPQIGMGYDVHAFDNGDHVTLCGIKIPHQQGLKGHSDADVALHALCDAMLGAIAAGDIGDHFPPSDPQWRGASSDIFVKHALKLITDQNARLVNIDLTIICEQPKVSPHKLAMRENVAKILDLPLENVSIKATTTEKLGFTGRGEGIAAQACVMILKDGQNVR